MPAQSSTTRPRGNAVVGQSGGPTAAINSSLAGVVQAALARPEIGRIYGMVGAIKGLLDGRLVDLGQESPETIEGLRGTPSSALGSGRHKLGPNDYDRLADALRKFDIRYVYYIGGNDSADTTNQIASLAASIGHEMYVVGVPKTVDNDLVETDHCPGFGSAARYVALAMQEAGLDSEAIASYPVKVIEVMGRHAGWLAAAGAIARQAPGQAPHLVYVPERPLDLDRVFEDATRIVKEHGHCVISLAEGARGPDGKYLTDSAAAQLDAFGHQQMAGAGDVLAQVIEANTKIRARCDRPGTLQRASMALASRTDLTEAYEVGRAAVNASMDGETGVMVTIVRLSDEPYAWETGLAPVSAIANREKKLPADYMNEAGNYPTEAFMRYARPLIGDPLPGYVRLAKVPVS